MLDNGNTIALEYCCGQYCRVQLMMLWTIVSRWNDAVDNNMALKLSCAQYYRCGQLIIMSQAEEQKKKSLRPKGGDHVTTRRRGETHRLLEADSCRNWTSLGGSLWPMKFLPQQTTCPFGRKPQLLSFPATT